MSTLTLLITFLASLFKSHRQLALENLAPRQQVTILRQSVKRPRATAEDKLFCSKRDVNNRIRAAHNPAHPTNPSPGINPNTLQSIIDVEYVKFVGCNWSFLLPLHPILLSASTNISPREFRGGSL
jgi:hypothetical protein